MKAVFLTARSASTRLPDKCFLQIEGVPAIVRLIRRLKSLLPYPIILCTTTLDQELCKIAVREDILVYLGPEDKLVRWCGAVNKHNVDFFVTADGDDILAEPELIDKIFKQYDRTHTDFIYPPKNIICGAVGYGIKTTALRKVCKIKNTKDTEMMWVYFTDTGLFKCEELAGVPHSYYRPEIRMTLDYKDDLNFFREVYKKLMEPFVRLQQEGPRIHDIVALLDRYPDIIKINQYCQKAFLENQKKKTRLVLKNGYKPKKVSRK